jgi:flagellin
MSLIINNNLMAMNAQRNLSDHYDGLGQHTRRLSSGLRVGTAADDAAGLAVRELMRSEISALHQGIRNANDGISMVQVADGALQVIDEKLIRMKELAMQASTGTYSSDQRVMINEEFQAMAMEIQRIAKATDFNGIKLLDGTMDRIQYCGDDEPTGGSLIHFGTGNDEAEDYYHVVAGAATLEGLNLGNTIPEALPRLDDVFENGVPQNAISSGMVPLAYIPKGATNVVVSIFSGGMDDDLQLFSRSGRHLVGTLVGTSPPSAATTSNDEMWDRNGVDATNVDSNFITEANGFLPSATYNAAGLNDNKVNYQANGGETSECNNMEMTYSGDGDWFNPIVNDGTVSAGFQNERIHIDEVADDLLLFSVGSGTFDATVTWDSIPEVSYSRVNGMNVVDISTQESAQRAMEQLDDSIIAKDTIRANLGSTQNRLENTITNLEIQAENLQASESRISDADVAMEMTQFVKKQILTQSATAMLAQANSLPKMAMQLIGG